MHSVQVCLYIYIYIYVYIYMCVCVCVCMSLYTRLHFCLDLSLCTFSPVVTMSSAHTLIRKHTRTHTWTAGVHVRPTLDAQRRVRQDESRLHLRRDGEFPLAQISPQVVQ